MADTKQPAANAGTEPGDGKLTREQILAGCVHSDVALAYAGANDMLPKTPDNPPPADTLTHARMLRRH